MLWQNLPIGEMDNICQLQKDIKPDQFTLGPQALSLYIIKGEEALKNSFGECVNEWVSESEQVNP